MYDVIVVGARCVGAPTAMLLARLGYRVLLVDRASFPSDTLSTHFIKPPGVAMLRRWGLLDQVAACGCPPVTRFRWDWSPRTARREPAQCHLRPLCSPSLLRNHFEGSRGGRLASRRHQPYSGKTVTSVPVTHTPLRWT